MSEGGRLSNKLYQMRQMEAKNALAKAHQTYGAPCASPCAPSLPYAQETPSESDYLKTKVCIPPTIGVSCALSSSLTQKKIQCVLDYSINPLDPLARFSEYNPYEPPAPCPVLPINTNLPKATTKCPIPNKPTYDLV